MRNQGFTLVELITVIILLGILAVYAMPRIFDTHGADVEAAQHIVVSSLRLQQQRAMQDTANALQYGADFAAVGDDVVMTLVGPSGVDIGDQIRFANLSLSAPVEQIRFNVLGCVQECGQSDVMVTISAITSRSVCVNRQGLISRGNCQ